MNEGNDILLRLKDELQLELAKQESNSDEILRLSNEIANLDKGTIRFSVDANIIDRLGRELVGRHETAVSEIVKNAYDADARMVTLNFNNCDSSGGQVIIDDNGLGMTMDQLINGYMKISSPDKYLNPKSPRYNRTRAGQKGIGRFAVQRIGSQLTIITQTKDSPLALKLSIDWDKYTMNSMLYSISNTIEEIPKEKEEGTTLIINNVRDKWSHDAILRTFKYISELLQPFPLSENFETSNVDPGFKAEFLKDGNVVADESISFFQHAVADIEGYVDDEGQGFYSFKSDKLFIPEEIYLIGKEGREDKFNVLRNVHLKAYYFIYNVGLIPKKVETYIRENAEEYGGIRLYRNGFRVLPYAEKDDDWLRLDASSRRRSIIAPHGANSFYGFIEVIDRYGELFQEQSSREGLMENEAMDELRDFAYKVLTDVAIKVSNLRKRKATAGQKEWTKKDSQELLVEAKQEIAEVIEVAGGITSYEAGDQNEKNPPVEIVRKLKSINNKIYEAEALRIDEKRDEERAKQELLKEVQMLRILAGLGITIGEFVHEIYHYEPALKYDAELLTSLSDSKEGKDAGQRLQNNLTALTVYTAYFKESISKNVNRELAPIELRDAVITFLKAVTPDLVRSNIDIDTSGFSGYNLFTLPMHMSEWASILFNFYTNSKKAIRKARVNGKISIAGGKNDNYVFLDFSDNGIGVPLENRERIFEPFFTTSPPAGRFADQMEELTGIGLGLKIVQDIVEGYGGHVFVKEAAAGYQTTIRIEIPKLI